jgi:hypothetical protein
MATTPKEMHSAVCNYKRENDKERKKNDHFFAYLSLRRAGENK